MKNKRHYESLSTSKHLMILFFACKIEILRCAIKMRYHSSTTKNYLKDSGFSTVVECTPCNQDVLGSIPLVAGLLSFSTSNVPKQITSGGSSELVFQFKMLRCSEWGKPSLMYPELAKMLFCLSY